MLMLDAYFVRHAESGLNADKSIIGGQQNDALLSPRGEMQATLLAKRFVNDGIGFDRGYCSQAVRTFKTAEPVYAALQYDISMLKKVDALAELDQGNWTGRPRHEVYTNTVNRALEEDILNVVHGDAQSRAMLEAQTMSWVEGTLQNLEGTVAIFGHGISFKGIFRNLLDLEPSEAYNMKLLNTSVSHFKYDGASWEKVLLNDASHLGDADVIRDPVLHD